MKNKEDRNKLERRYFRIRSNLERAKDYMDLLLLDRDDGEDVEDEIEAASDEIAALTKELNELEGERNQLDSAFTEFNRLWDILNAENDVTKELKAVKAAIDDLWLKLEQLGDKIKETRRMRESK